MQIYLRMAAVMPDSGVGESTTDSQHVPCAGLMLIDRKRSQHVKHSVTECPRLYGREGRAKTNPVPAHV